MMLSGVGPARHLSEHGIPVVADRPGVGANLQDHLQLRLIYKVDGISTLNERYNAPLGLAGMLAEYVLFRRGPLTMAPSQLGLFTRSDPDQDARQSSVSCPAAVARSLRRAAAQISGLYRERREPAADQPRHVSGCVRRDPADAPAIKPNYLSTDEDRRIAAHAIRLTRRIVAQPALAPYHPAEYLPGDGCVTTTRRVWRRQPATSAPPSFIRSEPRRWVSPAIR